MDATLIDMTATQAVPAPFWFIQCFKVIGFILHLIPMGLWFAGLPTAMLMSVAGGESGRRWSRRLMSRMPVLVALGINFGIVPLLFVQVAYPQFFYPATILMAWPWLLVVALLIPAYYGVYIYAFGLRKNPTSMRAWQRAAGWGSAICFCAIGFIFANAFSLMTNIGAWRELWNSTSIGGAALGLALNLGDSSLWPRWLMVFSLGLMTTGAWTVIDAAWSRDDDARRDDVWRRRMAWKLYACGTVLFSLVGSWYVFGTWSEGLQQQMIRGPWLALTLVTAALPVLPCCLLLLARKSERAGVTRSFALLLAMIHLAVLAANAISRQVVQNLELQGYMQSWGEAVQWSPLISFLVVFILGAALITWMLFKAFQPLPAEPPAAESSSTA